MAKKQENIEKQPQSFVSELEKWKKMWLDELSIRKFSNRTISLSKLQIDKFIDYCAEIEATDFFSIDKQFMKIFFMMQRKDFLAQNRREMSSETYNSILTRLRGFFSFITENYPEYIDLLSSLSNVKKVPIEKKDYKGFSQEENRKIVELLDYDSSRAKTPKKRKKLFAITILYYGGLRSDELLSLTKENFSPYTNNNGEEFFRLNFRGKGGKWREIPIKKENLVDFLDFLECEGAIFDFSYWTLLRGVKLFLKRAGISKDLTNHCFRHNLATQMVARNVNLQIVSEFMGHSNVSTTARYYSRVSIEDKTRALV